MRRTVQEEIQALEKRLGTFSDDDELDVDLVEEELEPMDVEEPVDDLDDEIAALSEELEEEEYLEEPIESMDEMSMEYASEEDDLESEIDIMLKRLSEDQDAELESEAQDIVKEDNADIDDATKTSSEEESIAKSLMQLAQALSNPVEDDGILQQDHDEVQKVMDMEPDDGTDDGDDGDVLPVVQETTDFTESDYIPASRLQEASARLDRVASALEKRGGKWVRYAFRVDKLADAIDGERKRQASRTRRRRR